jgi:hypothetical protein
MKARGLEAALLAVVACAGVAEAQVATTTISFQQGTAGYAGSFDRRIGLAGNTPVNGSAVNTDTNSMFLDGGPTAADRADYLIRFNDIVGGGGVPAGATVLEATLDLRTTSPAASTNSQTGGIFNVYRLAKPFSDTSSMTAAGDDFGGAVLGVEPSDGEADWVLGSYDGVNVADSLGTASVTRAVQSWVNGAPNHGLAVVSERTTDGWSVNSTGAATVANRPKLNVTYTTAAVSVNEFQQGVAGYAGTTDILPNLVTSTNNTPDDRTDDTLITQLGSAVSEAFLDGDNAADSYDTPYLVKFDGIFGGSLKLGHQIVKAELVLVSGYTSANADTPGPFTVHQLLVPFSTSSTYADFAGDATAMLAANQIAPSITTLMDVDDTEVVSIDVTSIVQNWANGAANNGIYIGPGTANGWQVFTSGATDHNFAPLLRIVSAVPEPSASVLAALALASGGLATRGRRRQAVVASRG